MKSLKETTGVFIVRIRLEAREVRNAEPIWRGVIEQIDLEHSKKDNKPMYFDDLDDLSAYIAGYLQKIGIHDEKVQRKLGEINPPKT